MLDKKLPQFLRQSHDERPLKAEFLRRIRNKIAQGDFVEYEKEIEEYAVKIIEGYFNYDYSAFTNRQAIENIKKFK